MIGYDKCITNSLEEVTYIKDNIKTMQEYNNLLLMKLYEKMNSLFNNLIRIQNSKTLLTPIINNSNSKNNKNNDINNNQQLNSLIKDEQNLIKPTTNRPKEQKKANKPLSKLKIKENFKINSHNNLIPNKTNLIQSQSEDNLNNIQDDAASSDHTEVIHKEHEKNINDHHEEIIKPSITSKSYSLIQNVNDIAKNNKKLDEIKCLNQTPEVNFFNFISELISLDIDTEQMLQCTKELRGKNPGAVYRLRITRKDYKKHHQFKEDVNIKRNFRALLLYSEMAKDMGMDDSLIVDKIQQFKHIYGALVSDINN